MHAGFCPLLIIVADDVATGLGVMVSALVGALLEEVELADYPFVNRYVCVSGRKRPLTAPL